MSTDEAEASSVLLVAVLVDGWQYECCGEPPVVGRRVSWRLGCRPADPPLPVVDLPVAVERLSDDSLAEWRSWDNRTGPDPGVARHRGLTVFVPDSGAFEGSLLRGLLAEDHHVDVPTAVPPTVGTITRVWLVSWLYRQEGRDRTWVAQPETAELVEVGAAPEYLPCSPPADDASVWRHTASVLAELCIA